MALRTVMRSYLAMGILFLCQLDVTDGKGTAVSG